MAIQSLQFRNGSVSLGDVFVSSWGYEQTNTCLPESYGATVDEGFIVGGPVGDFELLLCHGTVCVVGKIRDLILQLSKSSIYSTKPVTALRR